MRLVPRPLPTIAVVCAVLLTLRIGMVWRDAGVAFAQSNTAAPSDAPAGAGATPPAPAAPIEPGGSVPKPKETQHFSAGEVETLQELAKRRTELDQRSEALDQRELLMKAAEQRLDDKIARLKDLQQKVDAVMAKEQDQDDQRLKSLVKVYEAMKPQEAASIIQGMEIPALLPLMTQMKEQKTAPILAAMAPEKARAITLALAARKDAPDVKAN